MSDKFTNNLRDEKSPYLQQHVHNPVNWYPWGDNAFNIAKKENKPIFLSIGYSTCHWCHVMEHESFENYEVAELMNEAFINIKVDREERPDIDAIYMKVCQMMTGSGGWPLNVLLTPELKPFFAGTYFPKDTSYGRLGMLDLAKKTIDLWSKHQIDVRKSAEDILNQLKSETFTTSAEDIGNSTFKKAYHELASNFDEIYGGFGSAPKFPVPHHLTFLMRYYNSTNNQEALEMVEKTLKSMRFGGIFDHIGYGFHRYSTDDKWLVPHFEKMLYDQALLMIAYTELYQITQKGVYKDTIEKIANYLVRVLLSADGGFYSAEDADSEGEEGKFYVWTINEIRKLVPGNVEFITDLFNISPEGNFHDERTSQLTGNNILHITKDFDEISKQLGISIVDIHDKIILSRQELFNYREQRVKPHLDDKILTDWNGLMIAALSTAGAALNNPQFIDIAEKAYDFIQAKLIKNENQLLHRFRDGESAINGMLDDYSFLIYGLLKLFQANSNTQYLKDAIKFTQTAIDLFEDDKNGGFYLTAANSESLIIRTKELYDGALPSGNSIMLYNLLTLYKLTAEPKYNDIALKQIKAFSSSINKVASAYTQFLNAVYSVNHEPMEIVLVCDKIGEKEQKFISRFSNQFFPSAVLIVKTTENSKELSKLAEFTAEMNSINGESTVYICRNFACEEPLTDFDTALNDIQSTKD